jgi:hypothetical protein
VTAQRVVERAGLGPRLRTCIRPHDRVSAPVFDPTTGSSHLYSTPRPRLRSRRDQPKSAPRPPHPSQHLTPTPSVRRPKGEKTARDTTSRRCGRKNGARRHIAALRAKKRRATPHRGAAGEKTARDATMDRLFALRATDRRRRRRNVLGESGGRGADFGWSLRLRRRGRRIARCEDTVAHHQFALVRSIARAKPAPITDRPHHSRATCSPALRTRRRCSAGPPRDKNRGAHRSRCGSDRASR